MTPTQLLSRTALTIPLPDFLTIVAQNYPAIQQITKTTPILEGYESANYILEATSGTYVLKIFEKNRDPANIHSMVKVIQDAHNIDVPVPEFVRNNQDVVLGQYTDPSGAGIYYWLTRFFDGANFENRTPDMADISAVTQFLARLNTLQFPVTEAYDSWGTNNLVREYEQHAGSLSAEVKQVVEPIVYQLKSIDTTGFLKVVIHADIQRKHVFKNATGDYILLDFGCVRNDLLLYEVSMFLAWFCYGQDVMQQVLEIYGKIHPFSEAEVQALPLFMKGTYAAYYMKTSLLIADGDNSEETKVWHEKAKRMLA